MSNFFKRVFFNAVEKELSNSTLVQRAAQKAARMEREVTGEKLGLWAGAAARELSNDFNSLFGSAAPQDDASKGPTKVDAKPEKSRVTDHSNGGKK
ncbi:hypothetical protein ADEAN_000464400 [Angomonas deanei]|uniref:Uncharacterized protein n=1 Tax=Angomonas deanei TaxID=59799 RepID=A0A7G2CBI1_9TRYP|nr:hypothetical protein ADEAN_000464400 [Angomonas deanei]